MWQINPASYFSVPGCQLKKRNKIIALFTATPIEVPNGQMHTWYPEFVRRIISRGPSRGIDSRPIPMQLYAVCMDSLPT